MKSILTSLILFVSVTSFHLWSLMRYPAPFVDEAWSANRAWGLIYTGRTFGTHDSGVFDRFEGYWTFFPWLPTWIQAISQRFSTAPNLFALRLVSLGFGLILLVAIYTIGKCLDGKGLGLLSVFMTGISSPFLYSAHLGRFDIFAAAFGFGAIAVFLNSEPTRFLPGLICGLAAALALEVHAHSAVYLPTLAVLYIWRLRGAVLRSRIFWGSCVGGIIGLAFYCVLHILPYPQTYSAINRLAFSATHVPPILTMNVRIILQAIIDTGNLVAFFYFFLWPLVIASLVAAFARRSASDKTLLVLSVTLVLMHTILVRNKLAYYTILMSPVLDILIASLLYRVIHRTWEGKARDFITHSVIFGIVCTHILLLSTIVKNNVTSGYQFTQRHINEFVPPNTSVMAAQTYWFGLYEHKYYSWEALIYYRRYAPGSTLEDALRAMHPDIFIIDGHLRNFISDEPGKSLYSQYLRIPKTELYNFLDQHAEKIARFDSDLYGEIEIYHITWDNN